MSFSLQRKLSRGPMGTLGRLSVNFEGEFDAVYLLVSQTSSFLVITVQEV